MQEEVEEGKLNKSTSGKNYLRLFVRGGVKYSFYVTNEYSSQLLVLPSNLCYFAKSFHRDV